MSSVAILPARGGSQRIPRKNIRPFHGRPMIAWAIEAALVSKLFDRVVVSTDDEAIAEVARAEGAEVPFLRPTELADHKAPMVGAVVHTLEALAAQGAHFDDACMLMATAPFVRAADLVAARAILAEPDVPCVLTVTDFGFPIFRGLRIGPDGALSMFWPEHELTRSNDLEPAYHDAGQFLWIKTAVVLRDKRLYVPGMRPLILPRWRVQDIDTEDDWTRAEHLFALLAHERSEA